MVNEKYNKWPRTTTVSKKRILIPSSSTLVYIIGGVLLFASIIYI